MLRLSHAQWRSAQHRLLMAVPHNRMIGLSPIIRIAMAMRREPLRGPRLASARRFCIVPADHPESFVAAPFSYRFPRRVRLTALGALIALSLAACGKYGPLEPPPDPNAPPKPAHPSSSGSNLGALSKPSIPPTTGSTMGTAGMRASLVSREVVADSIELVASAHCFDALVCVSGCDKTIPGTVMALARLDVPGLMLYGGSIRAGRYKGQDVTIQQVFEAVGEYAAGKITEAELHELEEVASPGAGACAGQFTANTMAMAFEVLGISPAGSAMVPAEDGRKLEVAKGCGELVMDVLRRGLRPSEVITKAALENAIAAVATSGGSTNGVLHLLAVAREAGVPLEIDEFDAISERTPLLCDLQPGGGTSPRTCMRRGASRSC